jgi:vancomycin resistance protein YoaR
MFLKFLKSNKKMFKWLLLMMAIFFIIVIMFFSFFVWFEKKYENKIYPGIKIGEIDFKGLSREEAKEEISKKVNKINEEGIDFVYNEKEKNIKPIISTDNPDLAYEIIRFNVDSTVDKLYSFNRDGSEIVNFLNKIKHSFKDKEEKMSFGMNEGEIEKIIFSYFSDFNIPAESAKLVASSSDEGLIEFSIEEEKFGKIIDYKKGIKNLGVNLLRLDNKDVELYSISDYPEIRKNEILNHETKVREVLSLAPIKLKYNDEEWVFEKERIIEWLVFEKEKNDVLVGLDSEKVNDYLKEYVAPEIDKSPINGRFKKENNKVIEFKASTDGLKLDLENNVKKIKQEIKNKNNQINLEVDVVKSAYSTDKINDVGIKELIGVGHSNFAGSPKNRRHNIAVGAAAVNGLLIEPNEEFSLVKALGEIDASTGYLPELVIKGNETIPEYGGGLCQVGTTLFRSALNSGLEITARRNHSYRVSYYEPAGTDASVYDPWPDLRFVNDTGSHVLIQSRIEGDDIYFDFWGTGDGRKITVSDPTIYNIVKPKPTKIVETLDLEPGEKKCTERAHNGADAYFDYIIEYSSGEIKERRFHSHYVPWQEVCLIGVEELSEEEIATSTEETVEE